MRGYAYPSSLYQKQNSLKEVENPGVMRRALSMRVSIVMPVYNAENFLEKAVRSVIDQTYKDIELILVNDGSTDSSQSKCEAFGHRDPRIKVVFGILHKGTGILQNGLKVVCTFIGRKNGI